MALEAEVRVSEFNAQDSATTAWAFTLLGQHDEKPFTALALEAEVRVSEFNARIIVSTAWAFAMLGRRKNAGETLYDLFGTFYKKVVKCLTVVSLGFGSMMRSYSRHGLWQRRRV